MEVQTETTRQAVARLVRDNPEQTARAIADTIGVSREMVRRVLRDLGYRLTWVRRRARG